MRRAFVAAAFVAIFSFIGAGTTSALGLKIAPLEYKTTLKKDERQQGFIDVSNPSSVPVTAQASVQAFKQINDDGGLQFYDDKQVQSGITLELTTIEMGAREAVRVAFTVNGSSLPEGDVYAAIFFTTDPKEPRNGVGQSVRVGTILSIINTTPGQRRAEVTKLDVPLVQFSDTASGAYSIKNTGNGSTGFYPTVKISGWPGGRPKTVEGSLLFAGRERSNDFSYASGFGIHRIEVAYGDSKKSRWVVSVAPWMLVLSLLVLLIILIELMLLKKRRTSAQKSPRSTKPPTP